MQYSEKGRKYKSREEYEKAKKSVIPRYSIVLVVTDREAIYFSNIVGDKKV
jgi:hypothetical protein